MPFCVQCGESVELADKFCRGCGHAQVPSPAPPPRETPKPEERRMLTVLFCDLVGSTELASRLDPEETHELIQLYQTACGQEIERFGGYTAQYLGDGILVYFGYPVATDDAAEQAVRCALSIREAIAGLGDELQGTWGVSLAVRVGVHSGLVVIGDMGSGARTERLALGQAPNIAARIQAVADPDEVLISDDTRKLTQGRFALTERGESVLKGVSKPVPLFAVQQQVTNLLRAGGHAAHVPIRGRDTELIQLDQLLESVSGGGVRSACVVGPAGSGKSHLLGAFLASQAVPVVELYCSEHYINTPFWPLSAWLEQHAGLLGQPRGRWRATLSQFLESQALPAELLPGLAGLLGLDDEDTAADAATLRHAMLHSVCQVLSARSGVVVLENRQWADASTRDVLDLLMRTDTDSTLLVVSTSRPTDQDVAQPNETVIALGPIDRASGRRIVCDAVGAELSEAACDDIFDRASGLPMFVSELAKQREVAGSGLPTSLHSLLLNQLERVQDAKRVAQEAAVLGQEFVRDDLHAVSLYSDAPFDTRLSALQRADVFAEATNGLRFSHTLMQEVAHDSLLRKSRAQIHRRTAVYLQEWHKNHELDRHLSNRLAHHWVNAVADRSADSADIITAIEHLQRAAESSLSIAAYAEAGSNLDLIDRLIGRLEDGQQRDELKLAHCMTQCVVYCARAEFASPAVESEVRAAEALCRTLGRQRELAQILLNLWMMHISRSNYPASLAAATESLALAEAAGDEVVRTRALAAISNSLFWLGRLNEAHQTAHDTIELYTPGSDPRGVVEHGWDAGVQAYMVVVWSSWLLGKNDTLDMLARMRELTRELDHPFNRMLIANTAAVLQVMRGVGPAAVEANAKQVRVANAYQLAFYKMLGAMFHGVATVLLGRGEEGFDAADKCFQYYESRLGGLGQSFIAASMVIVYAARGDFARAAEVADYGLASCARSREGVFVATLTRQRQVLTEHAEPQIEQLLICGDSVDSDAALDPRDPRNVWVGRADEDGVFDAMGGHASA